MAEYDFEQLNETQKVQYAIHEYMDVTEEPTLSIPQVASRAGVGESITKKVLHIADCVTVKRTGGPIFYRKVKDPPTVTRLFDATTEPLVEQETPIKCRKCRYANTGLMQTAERNKDTVSGCLILETRKSLLE